jgi:hypothetical protein
MSTAAYAGEPNAAAAATIAGSPLWLATPSDPLHAKAAAGESMPLGAESDPPITLGTTSSSVKRLASRVLGQRHPCVAAALMLFDPPQSPESRWELVFPGLPSPITVALMADNAPPQQIYDSIQILGPSPIDLTGTLQVAMKIVTQPFAPDATISTVVCEVVDGNGVSLQALEQPIRVVWRRAGSRLLGLYGPAKVAVAESTGAASKK